MSESSAAPGETQTDPANPLLPMARALGLVLVLAGLLNTMPSIPGLQALLNDLWGGPVLFRRFPSEWFYPLAFLVMMTVVALQHSFWASAWASTATAPPRGRLRKVLGALMDVALVTAAFAVSMAYLIEVDSVCLIDRVTGERARMIEAALIAEREMAILLGMPEPTTVDAPGCSARLDVWLFAVVFGAVAVFLAYNIRVWGLPLVAVAIVIAAYAVGTVLIWYVWGDQGMNRYLITRLGSSTPRTLMDGIPNMRDVLLNNAQGLLGRFMGILLNTVFPYIVLGALFGISAGGRSLIKIAFIWTRRLRGGPAHAAIVSSALFGTISGGPVVNVLSTGRLTIPMMLKRGFNPRFAGGVEAAASSGGQIMPPVMGVAAFVLAAMTVVPYREVIIAAVLPALAYFGCLFLTVVFQARKQGIEAIGRDTRLDPMSRADWINLVMILAPILLILLLLITPKETVGCGPVGALFGAQSVVQDGVCRVQSLPWFLRLIQNSAGDAGSAGWWAVILLMALFFLDREIRAHPGKLVRALADAGLLISTLYLMFLAVSVIDFSLNFTGLSSFVARDFLNVLGAMPQALQISGLFLFMALFVAMLLAILLGMGMPTVPAYINVALLLGPLVISLGVPMFTAHMFIFFFAVASAITPPVAVAAFAAASITRADPLATGFAAVRAGIVLFVLPFIFVAYPELLLIDAARLDPAAGTGAAARMLPGHAPGIDWAALAVLIPRVVLALYLLSSALAAQDLGAMRPAERLARLALTVAVLLKAEMVWMPACAVALGLIWWHWRAARRAAPAVP